MDFRERVDKILTKSVQVFGEEVTFYPRAGGVYNIRAIFDNEYFGLDVQTEKVVSVNQPNLGYNINDLPIEIVPEDAVLIRGIKYRIQDKREDGQGGARLMLHRMKSSDRIEDTRIR
jgi:hypothetical protein